MKLIFTLIVLCFSGELMAQKAGTPDSSFGVDGKTITSFGDYYAECVGAAAMNDGSIIAAGNSGKGFFACKYSANGLFDTSFGINGIAFYNHYLGIAETMTVGSDNKILIAGYGTNGLGYYITVIRFNPDGTLDSGFGINGIIKTNVGENCHDITVQPDGKILIAAETGTSFLVLRYLQNGILDSSFGNNGLALTYLGLGSTTAIALQKDGKMLVTGSNGSSNVLVRYDSNGNKDSDFGMNGEVFFFKNSKFISSFPGMVVQTDGMILLAGSEGIFSIADSILLVRFNSNGSFDTSFGKKGRVASRFEYRSEATRVALEKDGKIIICGDVVIDSYHDHFLVAKYNTNGTLDSLFGHDGHQVTDIDATDIARGLIVQQDSKIVLAGLAAKSATEPFGYEVGLTRYNNDDETKKQIIVQKIKHYLQTHNDAQATTLNTISVYPNPAQNILHVKGLSSTQKIKLTVVDLNGNVVVSRELSVVSNVYNLNIASLHAGNYLLKIETNGETVTKQFVKE